jgi:p-hydroxybenzoate 3-monooxygenase
MRTQVGILGAGPAGLTLARLLQLRGIESVVLELHDQQHVEGRVRAGVLEQGTVDVLDSMDVGERVHRQGLVHWGIELRFGGHGHRIDFSELTDGRSITIYGQHEVIKDLIAARLATGDSLMFEAEATSLQDLAGPRPTIRYRHDGRESAVVCDFVAGCDGFHGISRRSVPESDVNVYERLYPFAWLGILAATPPPSEELIYAYHERGFALASMRTPAISRLYLQCAPDEDLERWPDQRIW